MDALFSPSDVSLASGHGASPHGSGQDTHLQNAHRLGDPVFLASGINSSTISNGVVAVVAVTLSSSSHSSSVPISVSTPMGAMANGTGGSVAAVSGTITVAQPVPIRSIAKSHTGSFTQGQTNASYSVTVNNASGAPSTSGTVTVTETVPVGMTLVSMAGSGWTCPSAGNTCTRSDALAGGASYPVITVTVNVASNAGTSLVNSVTVSGGGSANATATDATSIQPSGPTPITIWSSSAVPQNPFIVSAPVTLGVKFRSDVAGTVTGFRFYKGAGNNGFHIGLLYNSSGTLLAQA